MEFTTARYGRVPGFEHARVRTKDFHCRDQVFHMRQLVDARRVSESACFGLEVLPELALRRRGSLGRCVT